jgi:trehalose 6-phosphate phosphatase
MRERPFSGPPPVFIGDDLTDEYGFRGGEPARRGHDKGRPGETVARWRIADAAAVRKWLAEGLHTPGAS